MDGRGAWPLVFSMGRVIIDLPIWMGVEFVLYHVSPTSGLKKLEPRKSTHGKAYVYAVENRATGLLFGAKQDDFDLMIFTDEHGVPIVYECYPNALEYIYRGKSCSVYCVDDAGFQKGKTSWDAELVCERTVPVLEELAVKDLYQQLLQEESDGKLELHRYAHNRDYRKKIAEHITDRLIRFEIDLEHCMEQDQRFATYYKDVVQALREVTDGHLLL